MKQKIILFLTVYSLFTTVLLSVFYLVLLNDNHFYEWNIVDKKKARSELFITALEHLVIFLACVGYQWHQNKNSPPNSFKSLNQHDEDDFHPSESIV